MNAHGVKQYNITENNTIQHGTTQCTQNITN